MSGMVLDPMSHCDEQEVLAEEWVSITMKRVVEYRAQAQEQLRGMFGAAYDIDEMALMFTEEAWALRWISSAVRIPGVNLFNTAHDAVQTRPVPSSYNVHYWFLSTPAADLGDKDWRIEAMFAHPGSPLHDVHLRAMQGREICVMHASFKCPDEEAYAVAVKTLADNGYEAAQLCQSTYGRFSYWAPEESAGAGVYLKPRVNLRDAENDDE